MVKIHNHTPAIWLTGVRKNPYGKLSKFTVQTVNFKDLLKIDIEGAEKK